MPWYPVKSKKKGRKHSRVVSWHLKKRQAKTKARILRKKNKGRVYVVSKRKLGHKSHANVCKGKRR
jgi:hypothetical protein